MRADFVVAASLAYSVYETRVDRAAAYFLTTTRMWELGAGGVLAMLPERVDRSAGKAGSDEAGWLLCSRRPSRCAGHPRFREPSHCCPSAVP